MQIQLAAESHVPCFQERVGTGQSRYMIAVRLPWRLRARPSATLHEIQVHSEERTCCLRCYKMRRRTSRGKLIESIHGPIDANCKGKNPRCYRQAGLHSIPRAKLPTRRLSEHRKRRTMIAFLKTDEPGQSLTAKRIRRFRWR